MDVKSYTELSVYANFLKIGKKTRLIYLIIKNQNIQSSGRSNQIAIMKYNCTRRERTLGWECCSDIDHYRQFESTRQKNN